jgi:hypothetical protein
LICKQEHNEPQRLAFSVVNSGMAKTRGGWLARSS